MSSLTVPFTPPPQFSRGTTPMKPSSEVETSPSPSPLSTPLKSKSFSAFKEAALRPEQERDISLFRSFCAVKLVLDAIWASLQIASGIYPTPAASEAQQREPSPPDSQPYKAASTTRAVRKLDLGTAETEDPEGQMAVTFQGTEKFLSEAAEKSSLHNQLYEQQVLEKLQEAKVYLSLVYPLNYRLEILENIFSLLFLTSDDIKQIKMGDLDAAAAASSRKSSSSVEDAISSGVKVLHTRSNSDVSAAISSIALIKAKHGFLASEKIASDLLDSLQDCIFELRAARYVLYQSTESGTGPSLSPSAMKSCISTTALQQRSTKLEQYINEARWRIQLVSAKHGITAGISARSEDWLELSSSGESGSEWTDSEDEGEGRKEGESRKKPKKATAETQEQKAEMPDTPVIQEPRSEPPQQSQQGQKSPTFGTKPPIVMAASKATLSGKISPAPNISTASGHSSSSGATVQRSATFTHGGTKSPKLPRRHHSLKERSGPRPVESSIPGRLRKTDDSGDADIDDKSPDQSKRRKRLRLRSFQSSLIKKRKRRISENSRVSKGNIICRMLASPSSLLRMCLKHSNYHRANEVLKMFGMEGQFGEAFVRFSEQYEMVSRELAQRSRSSTPKQSPSLTPGDETISHKSLTTSISGGSLTSGTSVSGLKTSSMSVSTSGSHMNLQVAIMNATNSSVALESLHRLLAPSSINRMLFSGDEHLEKVAQESGTLRVLVEHVPTLVMLDLVCSTKVDGQIAKRIIELAAGRCRPALETRHLHGALTKKPSADRKWSQPHELSLSGPFSLLLTLSDVSGYFTFAGMIPPTHSLAHSSPYTLFTSYTHHFKVNAIMNANTFSNSYNEARERVEGLLYREGATEDDVITLISSVEEDSPRPSHAVGNIFDELVRALKSTPHSSVLASSAKERSLMKQPSSGSLTVALEEGEGLGVGYVWQFSRYLSKLIELLCKCLGTVNSSKCIPTCVSFAIEPPSVHILTTSVLSELITK